jgi:hypothetical protein
MPHPMRPQLKKQGLLLRDRPCNLFILLQQVLGSVPEEYGPFYLFILSLKSN